MADMIQSTEGLIHFIAGILALITGTAVLLLKKGTRLHQTIGYAYVVSMVVLLVTSFMIYRLFNGWGVFHYASIISCVAIFIGMIPPLFLRHKSNWLRLHLTAMYWSVIGLWAAFVAEMTVRIPSTTFFWMVGLATGLVFFIGVFIFAKKKLDWIELSRQWTADDTTA